MPRKKKLTNEEKSKQTKRTSISSENVMDSETKIDSDDPETEKVISDGIETVAEEPEVVSQVDEE
jgi:hypothetical protein